MGAKTVLFLVLVIILVASTTYWWLRPRGGGQDYVPGPGRLCLGVLRTDRARPQAVMIERAVQVGLLLGRPIMKVTKVGFRPYKHAGDVLNDIERAALDYLQSGDLYFLQPQAADDPVSLDKTVQCIKTDNCEYREASKYFATNASWLNPDANVYCGGSDSRSADPSRPSRPCWLVRAIRGHVVQQCNHRGCYSLISRHSPARSGPRLLSQGLDAAGNASLTVETEVVAERGDGEVKSYAILRGSIPVKWRVSTGWTTTKPTPVIDPDMDGQVQSLRKHVALLRGLYGEPIVAVDLLNQNIARERRLSKALAEASQHVPGLVLLRFDMHTMMKRRTDWEALLLEQLAEAAADDPLNHYSASTAQRGVVRVNCFSVLDRTSVVQAKIMLKTVEQFFDDKEQQERGAFASWLAHAWVDTAHALGVQNSGELAQQTEVIRKGARTVGGRVKDLKVSLGRYWQSNRDHQRLFQVMQFVHGGGGADDELVNL